MIKIVVNGCNGNMGKILSAHIQKDNETSLLAGIDRTPNKFNTNFPIYNDIFNLEENPDVIIDFSNPYYLSDLLAYGIEKNIPLVIATTGFSPENLKSIKNASKKIPIFYSTNMSLGINILISLVQKAALTLSDTFDIEIIEKHHNKKIDSPSGTAYMIANKINSVLKNSMTYIFDRHSNRKKRNTNEIGIHSLRGGTIIGEHSVFFAGPDEIIEIKHTASSKSIFALGSIKAAKFIIGKEPGLYDMDSLIDEKKRP